MGGGFSMESAFIFIAGGAGIAGSKLIEFEPSESGGAALMLAVGILLIVMSFFKGEKLGGAE